jgi:hypothetical protein
MGVRRGDRIDLRVDGIPKELQRGIRMVCARKGLAMNQWIPLVLYQAINVELADYPEWRWETKPGEELALLSDGRKLRRTKK